MIKRVKIKVIAWAIVIALSGAGCAAIAPQPEEPFRTNLAAGGQIGTCAQLLAKLDHEVDAAGVRDAGAAQLAGFPYLRINRFLASFEPATPSSPEFREWAEHLQSLDQKARQAELMNLPETNRNRVRNAAKPFGESLNASLQTCGERLQRTDLQAPERRQQLLDAAQPPSEYISMWRVVGIYPLTSLFVRWGIYRWHQAAHATFNTALPELPVDGQLIRYTPAPAAQSLSSQQVRTVLTETVHGPFGVPTLSAEMQARLFATYAPIVEVDTAADYDRIGTPVWWTTDALDADTSRIRLYTRLSHTRFKGQILLQLNYIWWFPSRPKENAFDILGGRLDGINWRVTLAPDGRPLVYDSIHNCGCYHKFYPTQRLALKRESFGVYEEPPLIAQTAPIPDEGQRMILRLQSKTHYVQRVYVSGNGVRTGKPAGTNPGHGDNRTYITEDYDTLRSLPFGIDRRKSLFRPDGIVPGTQRSERWLLWPMGIPAPGAMRQWGHHATAFVGRRHFDEPALMERYFQPTQESQALFR